MSISKVVLMYANFKWLAKEGNENIYTNWKIHPYNLCLISAMIEDKYEVKIVDANIDDMSVEEFAEVIQKEKPDVVGISIHVGEYLKPTLLALKTVKEVNSKIKTVVGGPYAISEWGPVIKDPNVDYVILGEGEYVFKELCDYFNGDGEPPKKGIVYKKNDEVINKGRADFIMDLDALPIPSYDKVNFMKYATKVQREGVDGPRTLPYAHIITSRGCPYDCCFCEVGFISGKKPRLRSPENVIKEIGLLVKNYGIKSLIFDDDNLLIDKERARNMFQMMIDKKFNLKWISVALAVYKLDDELVELMKRSGCQYVDISIESGVERVLKDIIHKPVDLEHAKKMIKKLREARIDCAVNFVVGFPGETWQEIRNTIKFAESLNADYTKIYFAIPFPNTELYRVAKEKGCLVQDFTSDKHVWTDGCIQTDEFRPQDLRILRAYEWDRINFTDSKKRRNIARMMGVTEERLNEIRKETISRANP